MSLFVETVTRINGWISSNVAWGAPMLALLVGTGVYLTIRTGWFQFTKFGHTMKNTIGRIGQRVEVRDRGAVSPFQAVTMALAATVGTGNIAGVAGAITMGGPGAVFWMWISAFFGMMTKYAEVLLAVKYRERNAKGDWVGGPMYYIKNGLGRGWSWLGSVFCVFGALAAFGIGNMTQVSTIAGAVVTAAESVSGRALADPGALRLGVGIAVAAVVAMAVLGGVKRIGRITEKLVPVMSVLYILGTLTVIFVNIRHVGEMFREIFLGAFHPQAVVGGAVGITIRQAMRNGVSRGVFSNEAGLGSAPIAHAAADTDDPVKQALYGIFEVFMDTIVICTLTALTILISSHADNGWTVAYGVKAGAELTVEAFGTVFGGSFPSLFLAVGILLFASSTVLSWALYGSRCVEFLFGNKAVRPYQVIFVLFVILGAVMDNSLAWEIADTLNGLMAIPNLIALLALSGVVIRLTKEYRRKLRLHKY